jgi:hypothetical protein
MPCYNHQEKFEGILATQFVIDSTMTTTPEVPIPPAHKAAGVLPLRFHPQTNNVEALLAWEDVSGTRRCKFFDSDRGCRNGAQCEYLHVRGEETANELAARRLTFLGGKRLEDAVETPQNTAARRYHEETDRLISLEAAKELVAAPRTKYARLFGCYDLYINFINADVGKRIVNDFKLLRPEVTLACAYELVWVPLKSLIDLKENEQLGYHLVLDPDGDDEEEMDLWPVSHVVWSLFVKAKGDVEFFLNTNESN